MQLRTVASRGAPDTALRLIVSGMFCPVAGSPSHPSQNRSRRYQSPTSSARRDFKAPPCGVLRDQAEDEIARLLTRGFPPDTDTFARVQVPIQPEPGPVPVQDGVRLDKEQGSSPCRPQSPQSNPRQSVGRGQSWLGMVPRQDCELLPQGKIFQKKEAARPNRANERYKQEPQQARHGRFISQKTQQDRTGRSFSERQVQNVGHADRLRLRHLER